MDIAEAGRATAERVVAGELEVNSEKLDRLMELFGKGIEDPPGWDIREDEHATKEALAKELSPLLREVAAGRTSALSGLAEMFSQDKAVVDTVNSLLGAHGFAQREDLTVFLEHADPELAGGLLRDLFSENEPVEERLAAFRKRARAAYKELHAQGLFPDGKTRIGAISVSVPALLLFCFDPDRYTIYRFGEFRQFMDAVEYPYEDPGLPEQRYATFCEFAHFLLRYAELKGHPVRDLIDAHGLVWGGNKTSQLRKILIGEEEELPALIGAIAGQPDAEGARAAIDERDSYPMWWSFPIHDEYVEGLKEHGGDLYVYGNQAIRYRYHFDDLETQRGQEGIKCPWPEEAPEELRGRKRMGEKQSEICKTWLRITEIEQLGTPLGLDDFAPFQSDQSNVDPSSLRAGFAFVRRREPSSVYEFIAQQDFVFPAEVITNYLLCLKTKPFVILTGLSGTGKTKLAQLVARYFAGAERPDRTRWCFTAVRPDWMDSKGLLGFHNLITGDFIGTPFLRLMLRADKNPERRYFVILDEMNLAKVEYYFSDFLSSLESSLSATDTPERIPLHDEPAGNDLRITGVDGQELTVPREMAVPQNVYFTGTVNVDETTYMFSPKVLDRANTIEFNRVNLLGGQPGDDSFRLQNPGEFELGRWEPAGRRHWNDLLSEHRSFAESIAAIKDLLEPTGHHFGYRVAYEMAAYILNAAQYVGRDDNVLHTALDLQIVQKVLPKFHGTTAQIELPLARLLAYCIDRKANRAAGEQAKKLVNSYPGRQVRQGKLTWQPNGEDTRELAELPRAAAKVHQMLERLQTEGFASFIR